MPFLSPNQQRQNIKETAVKVGYVLPVSVSMSVRRSATLLKKILTKFLEV